MTDTTAHADELDKMREARTAASVKWWETWRYDPDSDLGSFNAGYEEGWQARAALSAPAQEPVATPPIGFIAGFQVTQNQQHYDLTLHIQRYSPKTYEPEMGGHIYAAHPQQGEKP